MNLQNVFATGTVLTVSMFGQRFSGVVLTSTIESWERKYLVRWQHSGKEEWLSNRTLEGGMIN